MRDFEFGLTRNEKYAVHAVPPILGAIAGWYLPVLARWILKLPWLPYQGIIEKIASYSGMTASIILCIVGIVAGIALSQFIFYETLRVFINDDSVTVKIRDTKDTFRKENMQSVYMDGKSLIFVGQQENEMFHEKYDGSKKKIARTFLSLGYPWFESDPYQASYRLWDENDQHIPAAVHALLRARKSSLENDQEKMARQLRLDLARIGVAVKDRKNKQYVRLDHSMIDQQINQ